MTKRDLVLSYLYRKSVESEEELDQLRHNLRNRTIDQEDALEFIIAQSHCDTINTILVDILRIFGL